MTDFILRNKPTFTRRLPWGFLGCALALSTWGVLMIISATTSNTEAWLSIEAKAQLTWLPLAIAACLVASQRPFAFWKALALPGYLMSLMVIVCLEVFQGTSLVPTIKGLANWIVIGPIRVQPVEFIKLATLLGLASLLTVPGFTISKFSHILLALAVAGLPAVMLARIQDFGSPLTFLPMAAGILLVAGIRLRHLAVLAVAFVLIISVGVATLPKEGPKAYRYKRIQAWLKPDEYALTEGYQTARSVSAIGSGQLVGKGYEQGDQNRLGMIPENHTDLIFAVIGEEFGLVGTVGVLALFTTFAWVGLANASAARDPVGRYVAVGYIALIIGQTSVNLAVATGLMPVTGVPLPFFSYGGSSLVSVWLGLGLAISGSTFDRSTS